MSEIHCNTKQEGSIKDHLKVGPESCIGDLRLNQNFGEINLYSDIENCGYLIEMRFVRCFESVN